MTALIQQPLPGMESLQRREPSLGELLDVALKSGAPIDVVKDMVAMIKEERTHQSNVAFDDALNRCQKAIETVLPDCEASNRVWASYRKLNSTVRPLYTAEGFSIAFTEEKAHVEGKIRIVALVSRQGITRMFAKEMTPVTVGAQGKAVMNMTDAEASIESRVKRYLIKDIFNIAVGNAADEIVGMTVDQAADLQRLV